MKLIKGHPHCLYALRHLILLLEALYYLGYRVSPVTLLPNKSSRGIEGMEVAPDSVVDYARIR